MLKNKKLKKWFSQRYMINGKLPFYNEYLIWRIVSIYPREDFLTNYFDYLRTKYYSYKLDLKYKLIPISMSYDDFLKFEFKNDLKYIERIIEEFSKLKNNKI